MQQDAIDTGMVFAVKRTDLDPSILRKRQHDPSQDRSLITFNQIGREAMQNYTVEKVSCNHLSFFFFFFFHKIRPMV